MLIEWIIASNGEVAIRIAKLIVAGEIPRIMSTEEIAIGEYKSRGRMADRYQLFRCELLHDLNGYKWKATQILPAVKNDT